jgi:ABC-type oligopeptide transport system ATPase subunit
VVCDEVVSALDVSTQATVINLLEDLQVELGLAYLFIAHDLDVVRHISHQIAVMRAGRIVEAGEADRVYEAPEVEYTRRLLAAVPRPNPRLQRARRLAMTSGVGGAAAEARPLPARRPVLVSDHAEIAERGTEGGPVPGATPH